MYHDEMIDFIADEFDTDVSLATISRTLQKENISRKKVLFDTSILILYYNTYWLDLATTNCTRTLSIASRRVVSLAYRLDV